jgi:hypothetical protein
MQRKKTSIKKVFSVAGLSAVGWFVFGKIAGAVWDPAPLAD